MEAVPQRGHRLPGVGGEDERLGAEADEQQAEGHHQDGGVALFRQHGRDLSQVQGVQLVVEDGNPHQDSSGTQGADGQILERTFDGAFIVVPECGQRHGGEGHDLDHDEDVEQVAREHQTQHGAGEHEEQAEIVGLAVIVCHIGEGIDAGGKHGDRDRSGRRTGSARPLRCRYRWPSRTPVPSRPANKQ